MSSDMRTDHSSISGSGLPVAPSADQLPQTDPVGDGKIWGADIPLPKVSHRANPAEQALSQLITLLKERGVEAPLVPQLTDRLARFVAPSLAPDTPYQSPIPGITILALAPQLAGLKLQRDRLTVVRELLAPAANDPGYRNFICTKLPFLIHFFSTQERSHLLTHALSFESRKVRAMVAFAVVRSCRTRKELMTLVSEERSRRLRELRSPELKELVAKAVFRRAFRDIQIPPKLSDAYAARTVQRPRIAARVVRARMAELRSALKDHLKALESYPALRNTRTAREYRSVINDSLRKLRPYGAEPGAFSARFISRHRGAALTNLLIAKVNCELRFGVHLRDRHPTKDAKPRSWQIKDIRSLQSVLKRLPEGHIEMAPGIHNFVLSRLKDYFGWRTDSGVIVQTDENHLEFSREFGGVPGRPAVLIHEIGHGLFLAPGERDLRFNHAGEIVAPGEMLFDFTAFHALSGWHVVTPQPTRFLYRNQTVEILGGSYIKDGTYVLDRPHQCAAGSVTFKLYSDVEERGGEFDEPKRKKSVRFVLGYDSFARFGIRANGCEDPFEDHAEGLTEYIEAPERFSRMAPEKFFYYHVHFRSHPETSSYVQYVYKELATRSSDDTTPQESPPIVNERTASDEVPALDPSVDGESHLSE